MNDPPLPFLIPKKESSMLFTTRKNHEFLIILKSFLELKSAFVLQLSDRIASHCSKLIHEWANLGMQLCMKDINDVRKASRDPAA